MEREWREASDMRRSLVGLGVVLAVATVLRFWALGSGIPFAVGADEPEIMTRVVRMMTTGDFNPHFFDYPSLYIYVQLAVACARFVLGASAGMWNSLGNVTDANFYLWGRVVTAGLGTATVYLVYLIGSRWGARHALLAAALMAVLPNHVRESHFVLTDVPMAFFTTLSFLLTLRALEKRTLGAFAWAGAVAGLAAATKYYGGLILVAPLLATYFASGAPRPRPLLALAAVGAAAGCFLLAAPYTVLDLPGFLNGFAGLSSSLRARPPGAEAGWVTYLKHLTIGLSIGASGWRATGYCGMLLLFWGLIHSIVRGITGPGQPRFILLILFPVLFFALVSDRTLIFARYLMPVFPFVALLIAIAIVSGVTLLRRFNIPRPARTALIVGLTVVAILPPAFSSVTWDVAHGKPSTYFYAYKWILEHVPPDAGVVIETGSFRLPAAYRSMPVKKLIEQDYAAYVAAKISYAVLSSQASGWVFDAPQLNSPQYAAYHSMLERMSLVAIFKNSEGDVSPDIRIFRLLDDRTPQTPGVTSTGRPGK
jgi:4-amino-4-deoxy-L-arabinose transferase-like glycosyltransferase